MIITDRPMTLSLGEIPSPIGGILIVSDESERIRGLVFTEYRDGALAQLRRWYPDTPFTDGAVPPGTATAMASYFGGKIDALKDLPVATSGSAFQLAVWNALLDIPAGTTTSYREIAIRVGDGNAVRAVGMANGANPVSLIVPCHRVIRSDSSLKGYGGGIERKRWLLTHEGHTLQRDRVVLPTTGWRQPGLDVGI